MGWGGAPGGPPFTPPPFPSIKRSNCYMVWGGEFGAGAPQTRSHSDAVIGCLVDVATGLMTFTANGKEINTFFQVPPGPPRPIETHCAP